MSLGVVYVRDLIFPASIRLGTCFANKACIKMLFQLQDDPILVDPEGEEVPLSADGENFLVTPLQNYVVVVEDDLDDPHHRVPSLSLLQACTLARLDFVREHYHPLHPELFSCGQHSVFPKEWLSDEMIKIVESDFDRETVLLIVSRESESLSEIANVFSVPFFNHDFCARLIEEGENVEASGMPISRPNSMNHYGIVLDQVGMEPLLSILRETIISPLSRALFPERMERMQQLDHHHGFLVRKAKPNNNPKVRNIPERLIFIYRCSTKWSKTGTFLSISMILKSLSMFVWERSLRAVI